MEWLRYSSPYIFPPIITQSFSFIVLDMCSFASREC